MNAINFLQSPWFWSLTALLPLLVVFYLLKLKRRRVVIPSTLLWRRSVQDLIANAPFQKLRNNLLLWLQLLLLALLILGFMRPTMKLQDLGGQTLVILLDNSASMQTVETDGETRFQKAKRAALDAIATMTAKDEGIIISFNERTNVVQTLTGDKGLLRHAVNELRPRDVGTDLREAGLILQGLTTVADAEGIRHPREDTKTLILSDGAIENLQSMTDVPNIEYVRFGETDDNLGITALDVRQSFSNTFEYQIFASITNSSEEEREAFVEFQVDGEVLDLKGTRVPPRGTAGVVFATGEVLEGIATLRLDGKDALEKDNLVRALVAPPSKIDILIVTADNYFLEQVFLVDPRVNVSVIRPTDYTMREEYDIVVFDNTNVAALPPGNFIFLNTLPPIDGFEKLDPAEVANPRIIDWNRVHPLTRFANFEEVLIGRAMAYKAPQSALPIVEALQTDLITLYETDTQRVLVIGFDIFKSYWPVDVSFPIFMANLIDYYSRAGIGTYQPSYATGSTIPIHPERDATKAVVTTPSGEEIDFSFDGISTAYLTETSEAGIYTIAFDNGSRVQLPVNLLSEKESMVAPRAELEIADRKIVGTGQVVRTNREIWHWLVLAALGFLMLEWWIYTRRTFM